MSETLFHQIRDGELPSHTVFENQDVLAFLDVNQATKGHTLIIPKDHYEGLLDCPPRVLSELMGAAKKIADHYEDVLDCDGFNIVQSTGEAAEQEVAYIHVHLVPRYDSGAFKLWHSRPNEADLSELVDDLRLT